MKKVLLASTALVLSAGFAAAEVGVSGHAGIWVSDSDVPATDPMVNTDIEISFSAEGTADNGLTMGLDYTIENANANGAASVDNWEAFISGSWGKLTTGDPDDALQKVAGLGDIGFDGTGLDNVAEIGRGAGSSDGLLYSYATGDYAFYLSHNADLGDDDVAVGVSAGFGDFKLGLGFEDQSSINDELVAVDLSGSMGAVGFDLYYASADVAGDGVGLIVDYTTGALTVSVGFADHDAASDSAAGIGFSYDLGGASLAGGVTDNGTVTAWDLGVEMDF